MTQARSRYRLPTEAKWPKVTHMGLSASNRVPGPSTPEIGLAIILHSVKRLNPFCILVVGAALILTPTSSAHAILVSSTPNFNAVLSGPGMVVKLRFNSRIDAARSRLILVEPDGRQHPLVIDKTSPPDSLLSEAKDLKPGAYILRWQALAEDGHITRGEVPFRIR